MSLRWRRTRRRGHGAAELRATTAVRRDELARELAASELAVTLAKLANALREAGERKLLVAAEEAIEHDRLAARLDRGRREREQELALGERAQATQIALLQAEAETAVRRFGAVSGSFSEALLALSRNDTLVKVAEAWSVQRIVEGEALGDTLTRLFHGTPLRPLIEQLASAGAAGK